MVLLCTGWAPLQRVLAVDMSVYLKEEFELNNFVDEGQLLTHNLRPLLVVDEWCVDSNTKSDKRQRKQVLDRWIRDDWRH